MFDEGGARWEMTNRKLIGDGMVVWNGLLSG